MQVQDAMTKDVKSVFEATPFKEIAELIEVDHVSALPVLDHRRPVGIVSAADLLLKTDPDRIARRRWPRLRSRDRSEERKARGVCARDLMTAPVITIEPEASISEAADRMLGRHVKRLPVVDSSGKLVGIVSRSDLLKVFLRADEEIKDEVEQSVLYWKLLLPPGHVKVQVKRGVVSLEGQLDRRSTVSALSPIVARVDGVVSVDNHVTFRWDDLTPPRLPLWAGDAPGLSGRW